MAGVEKKIGCKHQKIRWVRENLQRNYIDPIEWLDQIHGLLNAGVSSKVHSGRDKDFWKRSTDGQNPGDQVELS